MRIARATSVGDGVRFAAAEWSNPAIRDNWLPFLESFAADHGLPAPDADLLMKPINEYLVLNLPVRTRVRFLCEHYRLMAEQASPALLRAQWSNEQFEFGRLHGRSATYVLSFCGTSVHRTRKEGELTIALSESGGDPLAKLTLVLNANEKGRRGILIGGVQGPKKALAKDVVVSATRDLFGLRPRDAVLLSALAVADCIGARQAWGVSGELHVHHARTKRHQKRFLSDYDAFWIDRGAERAWPFGWILGVPAAPSRSGKTANGRRRDALKDLVWNITRAGFTGTDATAAGAADAYEQSRYA